TRRHDWWSNRVRLALLGGMGQEWVSFLMAKPRDARKPIEGATKAEDSIRHVVHDYTILLWCRWAVQQGDEVLPSIVRSHLAFSYFLPYRAFADFFSMKRFVPD